MYYEEEYKKQIRLNNVWKDDLLIYPCALIWYLFDKNRAASIDANAQRVAFKDDWLA